MQANLYRNCHRARLRPPGETTSRRGSRIYHVLALLGIGLGGIYGSELPDDHERQPGIG